MSTIEPMTKKEILEGMIAEAKNERTKCEIMERMFGRMSLKGSVNKNMQMQGMNQSKIRSLTDTLEMLEDFLKEEK